MREKLVFLFGSFRLDVANVSLRRGRNALVLTPKAFNVLRYLVEHAGQLVTKDDLWCAVWPGVTVTDATLTVCVNQIRKTLGDEPKTPRYIETVHRLGYRFIAPVSIESVGISGSEVRDQDSALTYKPRSPTPHFVARDRELAQLDKCLERALEGERQIVFVTGEPGIGKTTLVEQFLQREQVARQKERLWIGRGQCIEHYGMGEAYFPILDALGRLCREPGGGRLVELLDKQAASWLVQLPALLSADERQELERKVAGATHTRMLRELADAMEVISHERPLVLQLEDLHWSDHSTLDWLSLLARRQEPARLLVLCTYRPVEVIVHEHPLKNLRHELQIHGLCKELPLALLSESAVMQYLTCRLTSGFDGNLTSEQQQSESNDAESLRRLAHTIYQRTDGNPLFVVNMVDYLFEHEIPNISGDAGEARPAAALGAHRIDMPNNIVQMIEYNLERLKPDEQAVLDAASVAGIEFSAASIAAALRRSIVHVEACCARLARHEQFLSLREPISWPDGTVAAGFRFLHSLYQEFLYRRMPAGQRVELHRRIAKREEAGYRQYTAEIAGELAHHYSQASDGGRSERYYYVAGTQAVKRSAYREAIAHFIAGLRVVETWPLSPKRIRREMLFQLALGQALIAAKGEAAPEVEKAYSRALDLCARLGDPPEVFPSLYGLWVMHLLRGEVRDSSQLAEQLFRRAESTRDPVLMMYGNMARGLSLYWMGEFPSAREYLESAIVLYNPESHTSLIFRYGGADAGVACLSHLAWTLWQLGYPDRALIKSDEALALARRISDPFSLAFAAFFSGGLRRLRQEAQLAQAVAESVIALSSEHGFELWLPLANSQLGWAMAEQGRHQEGIKHLLDGLAASRAAGAELTRPRDLCLLAEAYMRGGRFDDAQSALTEALVAVARDSNRVYEAEIHRLKGELFLKQELSNTAGARSCFERAIEVARKQAAKSWEIRATTSLAQLLLRQGHYSRARSILGAIYAWFAEGFDTLALKQAGSLLKELGANPEPMVP